MKDSIKKIICICMAIGCLLLITGCSENTTAVTYTEKTIKDADDGYYVVDSTGTFRPFVDGQSYTSGKTMNNTIKGTKMLFMLSDEVASAVPHVGKDDSIIVKSSTALDEYIAFFKFADYGKSVGIVLAQTSVNGEYGISAQGYAEGSSAEKIQSDLQKSQDARVSSIGGQAISSNIVSDMNTITGLDADKEYNLVVYTGTTKREYTVTADTQIVVSDPERVYTFAAKMMTDNGYAYLQLPDNLSPGYYYIDGAGFFYKEDDNA